MENITKVYLLGVPLENDYKHTLYFEDRTAQQNYFKSKVKHSFENFSYQRKEEFIRIPLQYDDVIGSNYVMYQNTAHNNKWFYAFITDIKHCSEGRTDIYIETDVIQTYWFDIYIKHSFIEREHAKVDTIGANTLPEGLETGDFICSGGSILYKPLNYCKYIVGASVDLSNYNTETKKYPNIEGEIYNGIYSGVRYFYYSDSSTLNSVLLKLANAGQSEAVSCIFLAPDGFFAHSGNKVNLSFGDYSVKWSESVYAGSTRQQAIYKPENIDGYKPRNNKLFVYPYNYLLMSNNAGGSAVYKYELFSDTTGLCDFNINYALTPGGSIRLVPLKYSSINENNNEGLTGAKLPICNWTTDVYTNWLTQNSINIATQKTNAYLQIVGGAGAVVGGALATSTGAGAVAGMGAMGGGALSVASGINAIRSIVGEKYAHSLQPPQAEGNLSSGDVTYSQGDLTFTAYKMSIKKEYAQIIDCFFDMFGYATNTVKRPYENHRKNYWYTKTVDISIDGNIPNMDMQKIKNAYNNGITFWKNPNNIGLYNVDNSIV